MKIGTRSNLKPLELLPAKNNFAKLDYQKAQLDELTLNSFNEQIQNELSKVFASQNDQRTVRNTREYGYSFFKMEQGCFDFEAPPSFLIELGKAICRAFNHPEKEFTNIILSRYEEGFHLEPHVDVSDVYRCGEAPFYFDEEVYGLILEADETGHLYFVEWNEPGRPPLDLEPVYEVKEEKGTLFCLKGLSRNPPYYHGVSDVKKRRLSLTFRTVHIIEE